MSRSPSSTLLLAYVFWHRPQATAVVQSYEADLVGFHSSLMSTPPAGFVRSATFHVSGAPWLPGSRDCYEDWYLVHGWAAVGELNRAAVASAHVASHDRIAQVAESGKGGIYALRAGAEMLEGKAATWFAKPPGWSYTELDTALRACLDGGLALWQRQMTLGPTPEFCLRGNAVPALTDPLQGVSVDYRALH